MFAISARSRQHQPANSPSASTGRVTPGPEDLRVSHRPGTPSQLRRSAIDLLPQRDAGSIFLDSLSVARELGGMSPDASGRPQSQPWYLFPAPETLYGARPPETAAKQAPAAHIAASLCQVPPHRCECHSSATRPGSVPCFIFEKTPSPGAPLRNRTVDLLLTMTAISQPRDRRIGPDQAERWLMLAETGPGQPCPAAFCPLKCPRDDLLMTSKSESHEMAERTFVHLPGQAGRHAPTPVCRLVLGTRSQRPATTTWTRRRCPGPARQGRDGRLPALCSLDAGNGRGSWHAIRVPKTRRRSAAARPVSPMPAIPAVVPARLDPVRLGRHRRGCRWPLA
jgi:hypothetical protein